MKWSKALLVITIVFAVLIIAIGVFAYRGCISVGLAGYVILSFTLIAILLYAYFTYKILEVQQNMFRWNQNPVSVSWIRPDLLKYTRQDGKVDFKTFFFIRNLSRTHAVAKININPKVNEEAASSNDAYFGKKWWYVPAHKTIRGWFPLLEILESVKVDLGTFQTKRMSLRLQIKVVYKKWQQKQDRPMLENPPDIWYLDHPKWCWVHEPTTSEIQFPVFSNKE